MTTNNKSLSEQDIYRLSALTLAYIGDSVYELEVRKHFLNCGVLKAGKMHKKVVCKVRAESQAQLAHAIEQSFTDKEMDIYKRGRNAKTNNHPNNASISDYRYATGLEALIGYWHLTGAEERLNWLFEKLFSEEEVL